MDPFIALCVNVSLWVCVAENRSYSISFWESLPLPDERLVRVSNIELQGNLASFYVLTLVCRQIQGGT
jgi:hypothetical protein